MTCKSESTFSSSEADLGSIMNGLLRSLTPDAKKNKSTLINEIPSQLSLRTDHRLVAEVLDGILSSVVTHSRESNIRLSAKVVGHIVLVHVRKQGSLPSEAVNTDVERLHAMAERILGSVSLNAERKDIATLTFGFPNLPMIN